MIEKIASHRFLFEELVHRDFIKKYKRTVLGVFWSVLGPLATLGVMALVFSQFFGREMNHYVIYLFCGNLLFGYYRESTTSCMTSIYENASIFSKVNVPKYMFLLSKSVVALINFLINLVLLFVFCLIDGISFSWAFFLLIYPTICLIIFNLGMGFILSSVYIMFRDLQYLYSIFTQLLMYLSVIFYSLSVFPEDVQKLFYLNPIYVYISYFRSIIIDGIIPGLEVHLLAAGYAITVLVIGILIYKMRNNKFLYYI